MAINKEFLRHKDYIDSLRKDNPECSNKDFRNRACWKCKSCETILEECDKIDQDLIDIYDGIMNEDHPGREFDDMTFEEQVIIMNEVLSLVMEKHKARTKTVDQESSTDQLSIKERLQKKVKEMHESKMELLNSAKKKLRKTRETREANEQQMQEDIRRANAARQQQATNANSISFMDIYETIQEGYNEWNQNEANRAIREMRDAFKK